MCSSTFVFVSNLHIAELRVPELHWTVVEFVFGAETPFASTFILFVKDPPVGDAHCVYFWAVS